MMRLAQDLRYALRQLRKNPGFTTVAVITLALGIGANTAIFSNVNALLLRPFEFPDLDRIVAIWETVPKENIRQARAAPANFRDWQQQSHSFEHLAAIHGWDANLTGEGIGERAEGYRVTSDFFSLLGVQPLLGRNIGEVDFQHGAAPVVVLSQRFWQKHLASEPTIVGKNLLLNGEKFTVVGVARQAVDFPVGADLWAPADLSSLDRVDRQDHYLLAIGRIKQDSSITSASADLQTIASRLGGQFPNTNGGHSIRVVRLAEDATTGTRQFVLVLMGAAVFVLMLACVNVANLQLARGATRQKEIAVRMGLGASRWQLIRQLLVEGTLLSLIGATAGVLLANWGMGLLRRDIPQFILAHVPGLKNVHTDVTVLAFTGAVALISGILAGLAPALRFSRPDVGDALKENARGTVASPSASSLRAVLVTSEVALALVLLVGAGLMVKGFRNLLTLDMGFDRTHVLTLRVSLPEVKYASGDAILGYYNRALRSLQSLPEVRSAAVVFSLPSSWSWTWAEYRGEGTAAPAPGETRYTIQQIVTPDFFSTLRIPLLEGRFLSAEDARDSVQVAVISQSMARQVWPNQNPLGRHLRLGPPEKSQPQRRIVGVVADIRTNLFDKSLNPTTYVPLEQMPALSSAFVMRTAGNPIDLAASAAAQLRSVDAEAPAYDVRTLEQAISDNASGVESSARMMLIFGIVALALAAAGIFAVMSYSVSQRTHEIGLRMALGARRITVLKLVVTSAIKMAAMGLAIGLGISALLARVLSSALFGVVQIDAAIFALLTVILAIVSAAAAFIPARWASRIDPMQALRHQ
jgi:putative ABC transport system permease protein